MGAFKIDVISAGDSHGRLSCRLQSPSSSLNGRNPRCIWQWCSCSKKSNMQPTEGGGRPIKKRGQMGSASSSSPLFPSKATKQRDASLPPSLQRGELSVPSFSSVARSPLHRLHSPPPCVCVWRALSPQLCVSLFCMLSHAFGGVGGGGGVGRLRSALNRKTHSRSQESRGVGEAKSIVQTPRSSFFFAREGGNAFC